MPARLNRRELMKGGLAVGAAAAATPAASHSLSGAVPWAPGEADRPQTTLGDGYQFLSQSEAAFVEAAVARLIPADELGPGALEAGAALFIDRQLAGAFGAAQSWYMQGPWAEGDAGQGYQSRMTPAQLYRAAIAAVDGYCKSAFGGEPFHGLTPEQKDTVLGRLEAGSVELGTVHSGMFFQLLLQNTVEGFFCDPLYGGNRDMVGWKMIGFPGARYDYRPHVARHNQRLPLEPVGILGRPGWVPHQR